MHLCKKLFNSGIPVFIVISLIILNACTVTQSSSGFPSSENQGSISSAQDEVKPEGGEPIIIVETAEPTKPIDDVFSGSDSGGQANSGEFTPTDPNTVALGSGTLQFIEFFAYW